MLTGRLHGCGKVDLWCDSEGSTYDIAITYCSFPKFNLELEHDTLQGKTCLWSHDFQVLCLTSRVYDLSISQMGAKSPI